MSHDLRRLVAAAPFGMTAAAAGALARGACALLDGTPSVRTALRLGLVHG